VCKECASGGGGNANGVPKEYVDAEIEKCVKIESEYGLASVRKSFSQIDNKRHDVISVDMAELGEASITIPAYTSDLTNDSGFVTSKELGDIEACLDGIIEMQQTIIDIQNSYIGGETE
jgi:hypothetical protein